VLGPLQFVLAANTRAVRSLAEVFGAACPSGCAVRMTASAPVQMLGLAGDLAADAVMPLLPSDDVASVLGVSSSTNAASYRTGDVVTVAVSTTPGAVPVSVDVYVVLQTPAGEYQSLTSGGLVPGLRPFSGNRLVASASTFEALRAAVPAGVPPGAYQWLTALAVPGTLQLMTPVHATPFTVAP
jgi:hypothetical protein